MEYKKFQEEETDQQDCWGDEDIACADHDIVDAVDDGCEEYSWPESLDSFQLCETLPSEGSLCERETAGIIDISEECEASTSVECDTDHAKEYMWEVSEDWSEHRVFLHRDHVATGIGDVDHIFDILREGETRCYESDAIDIVSDWECPEFCAQEIKEEYSDCDCSHDDWYERWDILDASQFFHEAVDEDRVDDHDGESERFADCEYQEHEFWKFFQESEKYRDDIGWEWVACFLIPWKGSFYHRDILVLVDDVFEYRDEICPFDIDREEKERYLLCFSGIVDWPVERQKYARDDHDTCEEHDKDLFRGDIAHEFDYAAIDECTRCDDCEWYLVGDDEVEEVGESHRVRV